MSIQGPETYKEALSQSHFTMNVANKIHPYTIGQKYLIRTVTHYYTGKLEGVYPNELLLSNAAWVADTGRYTKALQEGALEEVEPIPVNGMVIIGRGAIIDCVEWNHDLPREVK